MTENKKERLEVEVTTEKKRRTVLPKGPRLKIQVTDEIIVASTQADSGHCMVAEAVKRTCPSSKAVAVDIQTIRFTDPERGLRYTYLTPVEVQEAILNFDDGLLPEAFEFNLRGAWVALAAMGQRKKRNSKDPAHRPNVRRQMQKSQLTNAESEVSHNQHSIPLRVGGSPPEKSQEMSRRREFGMRLYRNSSARRKAAAALRLGILPDKTEAQ